MILEDTTTDQFPGHVAGEPYVLTREEFVRFTGIVDDYNAFLEALQRQAAGGRLPRTKHNYEPEQQAFWAAIASFEAKRRFQSDMPSCKSFIDVQVGEGSVGPAEMMWYYDSSSGTEFRAIECRKYNDYLSENDPATLPEPMFIVKIPEGRDQPGRTHYEAIRCGRSYCEF